MSLKIVKTEEQADTMNVLLYGPPKSGKTTGACSAPAPVLLVNADLPNAPRFAHRTFGDKVHEVRLEGLSTLIDVVTALQDEKPTYTTVVVDPVADFQRTLLDDLSRGALRPPLPLRGDAQTHLERFCRKLCELPVNTVIVCHETPVKDEASGQIEQLPFTGTSNPTLGMKLAGMVDIVGYCSVVEEEGQDTHYAAQLVNAKGRRGGDRFDTLGSYRDLDLSEWWAEIAKTNPQPKTQRRAA